MEGAGVDEVADLELEFQRDVRVGAVREVALPGAECRFVGQLEPFGIDTADVFDVVVLRVGAVIGPDYLCVAPAVAQARADVEGSGVAEGGVKFVVLSRDVDGLAADRGKVDHLEFGNIVGYDDGEEDVVVAADELQIIVGKGLADILGGLVAAL